MTPIEHAFELPNFFQLGATFIWAVSGAGLGVRRGFDYAGIFVMAFVSSLGGGLIRDGIFLQHVPVAISDPVYLPLVFVGAIVGTIASIAAGGRKPARGYKAMLDIVDAIGLGAYACVGAQMTLQAGLSVPAAIFVGVVNGVGGGLLRDILVNDEHMLMPGQILAIAALVGVSLFVALIMLTPMHASTAAWLAITVTFILRVLAIRYNWRTRALLPEDELEAKR